MTPRTGRPPKGPRPLRELSTLTIRLEPETKARLLALARETGRTAYELLGEAADRLWAEAPPEVRKRAKRRMH